MTLLDSPLERRLGGIEADLRQMRIDVTTVKTDLAVIKTRLDHLPTRWMFWLLLFSTTIPIYGILVTLFVALVLKPGG